MNIVLQFYPNGEFSQGVDTSSRRPPKCVRQSAQTSLSNEEITPYDLRLVVKHTAEVGAQISGKVGTHYTNSIGTTFALVESEANYCVLERLGDSSEGRLLRMDTSIHRLVHLELLSPLVHQSVESCEKPESRKKLLSMSKRMSRNIRNAVYLLERQKGGKDVLSFLTLTLPNLSTEGLRSCCINWDSMVKRFIDWLRTKIEKASIPLQHVYCTEIQTKRLTKRGEYAPHLHIVFRGRESRKAAWIISPKEARKAWSRCISQYVSEKFDTAALENLQRIKYSAARYLSKYLSKGSNIIPSGTDENAISLLRTQWGGMARTLSQSIRKNTQRFTSVGQAGWMAICMVANMEGMVRDGCVLYWKTGFIRIGEDKSSGVEYGLHVGCGCLRTPTYERGLIAVMEYISSVNGGGDCYDM